MERIRTRNDVGPNPGDNLHNRLHVGRGDTRREAVPKFAEKPLKEFVAKHMPSMDYTKEQIDALTFTKDNNGKLYIRDNVLNKGYDLNKLKEERPEVHSELEREIVKSALSVAFTIDKIDLNGITIKNGVYSYYDRQDHSHEVSRADYPGREAEFDQTRQEIEGQITALGFKVDSISMPDNIKKDVLKHVADHKEKDPTKTDQRNEQAKQALKDGIIHSYRYDKINDQLKFTIVPRDTAATGDKLDKNMEEVSIDPKSLPSEVRKGLEYHETKQAVIEEFRLKVDVPNLRISGNEIHFKLADGETDYKIDAKPGEMKNIRDSLATKGFDINTQQISDSVGSAALKHAIGKETDQAKKDALEDGMIYDYSYDKKNKEHVYHIIKKEKETVNGKEEVRDREMEKVSFTDDEHKALLDDAKLNAVRKYGELADGTKITDDMVVTLNDKNEFVVKDNTDADVATLTGDSFLSDGRKLKDAIDSELNVKPRVETEILTDKTEVLVGTKGTDSPKEILEKKLAKYENWTKHTLRLLKFMGGTNDVALQAAQTVGQVAAELLHSQDNPSQQQPIGSVATGAVRSWAKKRVKHNINMMKEQIKIESKKSGPGKGAAAGKAMEHLKEVEEAIRKNKDIPEEDRKELLHDTHSHSDSESDSSSVISDEDDEQV